MALQRTSQILIPSTHVRSSAVNWAQVQQRHYVIKPNVEKVVLNLNQPIGRVDYLFTKSALHLCRAQSEVALKVLDESIQPSLMPFNEQKLNSNLTHLLNLETMVKLIEKSELTKSNHVITKFSDVEKRAKVRSVAWLQGHDLIAQATQAASNLDKNTVNFLNTSLPLGQVLQLKHSMNLRLPLDLQATVLDWWRAYTLATDLQTSNSLYSTLTKLQISVSDEKELLETALKSIYIRIMKFARQSIENDSDIINANLKILVSPQLHPMLYENEEATCKLINAQINVLNKIKVLPLNQWNIREILHTLMHVRNLLREIASSLRMEATLLSQDAQVSQAIANWNVINEAHLAPVTKSQIYDAIKSFQQIDGSLCSSHANAEQFNCNLIQDFLPKEIQLLTEALELLSQVVETIPAQMLSKEYEARLPDILKTPLPASYDQMFAEIHE